MTATWFGTVKSKSGLKTIMVVVERYVKHPKYGKYLRMRSVHPVHDEYDCQIGEKVKIGETRRISKTKAKQVLERVRA